MISYEELAAENAKLLGIIKALKEENAVLRSMLPPESELPPKPKESEPRPQPLDRDAIIAQRLSLFRCLFRGREDIYARRYVSKDGQHAWYKPVCVFSSKQGWCTKFRYGTYSCSKCTDRQNISLTDDVIFNHLSKAATEEDVIGVYPIMSDNTVYFLCADFDDKTCKHGYKEDVLSYVTVCREWGIHPCIERSRSGKGAHVWIFFSDTVPAIKARKLGFAILREAMNHNGKMELNSYDRFLPNQDFLPKGGYGNLIALPLQGMARRDGNSVFVDDKFNAYDDQWQFSCSYDYRILLRAKFCQPVWLQTELEAFYLLKFSILLILHTSIFSLDYISIYYIKLIHFFNGKLLTLIHFFNGINKILIHFIKQPIQQVKSSTSLVHDNIGMDVNVRYHSLFSNLDIRRIYICVHLKKYCLPFIALI